MTEVQTVDTQVQTIFPN